MGDFILKNQGRVSCFVCSMLTKFFNNLLLAAHKKCEDSIIIPLRTNYQTLKSAKIINPINQC